MHLNFVSKYDLESALPTIINKLLTGIVISMPKTIRYYFYAAAATTAIAGIVHLILAYKGLTHFGISNFSIFFLVAGIAQLCWTIPLIKRWGRAWYYVGIGGTAVLIIIWTITRYPSPITGGTGFPINSMSIITEFFEFAFVIITAIIVVKERKMHVSQKWSLQ